MIENNPKTDHRMIWHTAQEHMLGDEKSPVIVNDVGDRRFVYKEPLPNAPHIKRTAFQGLTLYGEWVELMEVTEETYEGQNPFYTVGVFVINERREDNQTMLTQFTFANPQSGWEEGYRLKLTGNPATTISDLQEMRAHAISPDQLPATIDVDATVHAFYDQIEHHNFFTPPLFKSDYRTE